MVKCYYNGLMDHNTKKKGQTMSLQVLTILKGGRVNGIDTAWVVMVQQLNKLKKECSECKVKDWVKDNKNLKLMEIWTFASVKITPSATHRKKVYIILKK